MIRAVTAAARLLGGQVVPPPASIPLPHGVELRRSRIVPAVGGWLSGMRGPAAAVALGRVVFLGPGVQAGERLVRHELAHVAQWERHPWTFPFRYVSAHILHGYRSNPYEAEARAAETGRSTSGDTL